MSMTYVVSIEADGDWDVAFSAFSTIEGAKDHAEELVEEGCGESFEWTTDWKEIGLMHERHYVQDGQELGIRVTETFRLESK